MHKLRLTSFFALAISFACAGPRTEENATPLSTAAAPSPVPTPGPTRAYPVARAQAVAEQVFGQTVHDPYRWLEDVKSPEVQTWMDAEDKLARAELAKLPGRDALAARLREVLYVETVTPPTRRGNRFFYSRRRADQEKAVIYFREGEQGQEQVLIDPNALSPDGSISLHGYVATLDGKLVAYSLHKNNADYGTLHVMNVATRKVSTTDTIDDVRFPGSWTPKGDGFYYSHFPTHEGLSAADRLGESVVRFHKLGTDPGKDPVVREKTGDPRRIMFAGLSRDGHWLILSIGKGTNANDVYYRDMRKTGGTWLPLAVSESSKQYAVTAWKDRFYVRTDDGAKNYHVYKVDPRHPERASWKEIVPEDSRAVLEGASVVGNQLWLVYLR